MKTNLELIADIDTIVGRNRDVTDDTHMELVDEILSDCCTAPIIYTDLCSSCKEHI